MWRVDVTPEAGQAISELDASLREELIERVAELAEEPAAFLRRSRPPEMLGLWMYEYGSRVVEEMRMVLLFDRWDAKSQRIVLVSVGRFSGLED